MPQLSLFWPSDVRWLLHPVNMAPSFLVHVFTFWHNKMYQAHLELLLPCPQNEPYLQRALVPVSGLWYLEAKICVLGTI